MCWEKARGFLVQPERAFRRERKTKVGKGFRYALMLTAVFAVLTGVTAGLMGGFTPFSFIIVTVSSYIALAILTPLWGLWVHLWAYLLGARKGTEQTVKAILYAETPYFLLGWIPFVNLLVGIWNIVLEVMGLKELQGMSTGRAALAVLIPLVIVLGIIGVVILYSLQFINLGNLGSRGFLIGSFSYL